MTHQYKTGFTLIEMMLVIALFAAIMSFTFPMSLSFYHAQVLTQTKTGIQTTLRKAHTQALAQKNDQDYGVKILDNTYVLFEGSSYATRDQLQDNEVSMPSSLETTGLDEIVFSGYRAEPSATGTIGLSYAHESETITIHAIGLVE